MVDAGEPPFVVDMLLEDGDEPGDDDEQDKSHHGVPHRICHVGVDVPTEEVGESSHSRAGNRAAYPSPAAEEPGEGEYRQQVECGKRQLVARLVVQDADRGYERRAGGDRENSGQAFQEGNQAHVAFNIDIAPVEIQWPSPRQTASPLPEWLL